MSVDVAPSEEPLRVLLLAQRLDALRPEVPLPPRPGAKVFAASGEDATGQKLPWQVRRVHAGEVRTREAARVPAAWAQTQWVARRAGLPPSWLWAVKRDRWLRRQLGAADVVVSMDEATDGVLRLVPDLLDGATVLEYADRPGHQEALALLADLLGRLRALTTGRTEQAWLDRAERTALVRLMERVVAAELPGILVPVDQVADVGRRLAPALGQRESADVILNVLGVLDWATIPDAGTSGVLAQQAIAGLWLRDGSELPRDDELARAAQAALTGSDQALDAGAGGLARARLADAMGVLFHRERHAESVSTPLVPEPAELLAPLWANRTLQKLVSGGDRPRLSPEPSGGEPLPGPSGREPSPEPSGPGRPRVLAIPGVYGDFHQPVIDALQQVADVETSDVRMRFLSRRLLDPAVLDALAVLRGWGPGHGERDPHRVLAVHRLVTEALGPPLQRAQVIFTDWADRATVWASHMVPAETRLVVRIHSLDAFDPWLHLVDWSAVDHVIVVSDPLRVLVERLLALVGARVPVTVLPNLAALQAVDLPKEPGARTTLGLVGWGRRVKDPLCALELLAREPSWRLRLIGPDLAPAVSEAGQSYNRQVRALLDDPAIADRVDITGWTDDVASELRHVGVILSTSRRESWHLGLVEGAASGAVPVVRDWPAIVPLGGARALFPDEWVVSDLDEAEARVREVTQPDAWDDARHRAQREARERFDPETTAQHYREVILGPHLPGV